MTRPDYLADLLDSPPTIDQYPVAGADSVWWSIHRIAPVILAWPECPGELAAALVAARENHNVVVRPAPGLQPERGNITQYPLFNAMWAQPAAHDSTNVPVGRIGQAAVLAASAILRNKASGGLSSYMAPLQTACLSVRRMLAGKHVPAAVAAMPCPGTLKDLVDFLNLVCVDASKSKDEEKRMVSGLRTYLVDAIQRRAPRHRVGGSRSTTRSSSHPPEPDDPTPQYTRIVDTSATHRSSHEGVAPVAEHRGRSIALIEAADEDKHAALTTGQIWRRAQYRSRAIATASQGLLLGSDRLHLVDLAGIRASLSGLLDRSWAPSLRIRLGAVVASLSLLSGRRVDQLADLRVVKSGADLPANLTSIHLVLQNRELHLPVPELPNAFTPDADEPKLYRETIGALVVRIPELAFGEVVLHAMNQTKLKVPFRNRDIHGYATAFCSEVNSNTDARTTLPRIAGFLGRQVYAMSGDWADAALIAATEHTADARLYYYAPSTMSLVRKYDAVWSAVEKGLATSSPSTGVPRDRSRDDLALRYLGSRCCPKDECVRQMVASLVQSCEHSLTGRRGSARIRRAHNALALYTCMLLMWHTGVREVEEPIELTQFDPTTGYLTISDKDSDSYHSSRVAWLTPMAQKQIRAYWQHVDSLPSNMRESNTSDRALFFLGDKNERIAVTPDRLRAHLGEYPFRLNAQRHYLRTRLRELDVPGQTVDALLGHGAPGQEPYASHSCYSPARLKAETQDALETLARMAGWVVLPRN